MSKLPVSPAASASVRSEKAGFFIRRQEGSYIILRRSEPFAQLVVPDHKELDRGTLRAIIRQSGLTVEVFVSFL